MTEATPIYRAVLLEVERNRLWLGTPMWMVDDLSGVQDGYYAKMLHADTASGRQVRWGTLQDVVDALFPDGFDVIIKPRRGPLLDALSMKVKIRAAASTATGGRDPQREFMSYIGKLGGAARMTKISAARRSAIARKAGKASGRKRRSRASV